MSDLSVTLAAALNAIGVDKLILTPADLQAAKSRSLIVAPGPNGSMVVASRPREITPPDQPRLFAVS